MSKERKVEKVEVEKENVNVFSETLKKILETSPESRGPAAQAIMASFQVYYSQIGGSAAKASSFETY